MYQRDWKIERPCPIYIPSGMEQQHWIDTVPIENILVERDQLGLCFMLIGCNNTGVYVELLLCLFHEAPRDQLID